MSTGPQQDGSTKSSAPVATPGLGASIALPKGGGAIRGIGEKFAANPVTGTATLTLPIATSPGRAGFGPTLALTYDSGAGNGPFGLGWTLALPSITRRTDKGLPRYEDQAESDVFILSGSEDLVPAMIESTPGHCGLEARPPHEVIGGGRPPALHVALRELKRRVGRGVRLGHRHAVFEQHPRVLVAHARPRAEQRLELEDAEQVR